MSKRKIDINKVLGGISILLLILPVLFTIGASIADSFSGGSVVIDYLIPVKLFPMVFIGTFLLYIVSKRTGMYRTSIRVLTLLIVLSLLVGTMIAVYTGLSAGEVGSDGWEFVATVFFIGLYILSIIVQYVIGSLLFFKLLEDKDEIKYNYKVKNKDKKNNNDNNSSSGKKKKKKSKKKKRK